MPERRQESRENAGDRRAFPRPSFALNITLLILAVLLAAGAFVHRRSLDRRFRNEIVRERNTPGEIRQLRDQLASTDLSEQQIRTQLQSRLDYLKTLRSSDFYISLDTKQHKFFFRYANETLRDAPMQEGAPVTVRDPQSKTTWTFVPLRGTFNVTGKSTGYTWQVPSWPYLTRNEPVPSARPSITNGLGKYVIFLPNGYIIHSPPPPDSPLKGPKPGSFEVPEEDLAAIWPRISTDTRVFIF